MEDDRGEKKTKKKICVNPTDSSRGTVQVAKYLFTNAKSTSIEADLCLVSFVELFLS